MLPPENIHIAADSNYQTQLQSKLSLNNKPPPQKRNMPVIPEQDETFVSGAGGAGAERLDGTQGSHKTDDQIEEMKETTPDLNFKMKHDDGQSLGITYNEDDENSVQPLSLKIRNFKSDLKSPCAQDRMESLKKKKESGEQLQNEEESEVARSLDLGLYELDPSATEKELQSQTIFELFKDDMSTIGFSSADFLQVVQECLNQHMRENLQSTDKLYRYSMRKLISSDKQIASILKKLEKHDAAIAQTFQEDWQSLLRTLNADAKVFIQKYQDQAKDLVSTVVEEYISKWVARNIKLSNIGKNITDQANMDINAQQM